ncbi:MAG: pyruvate kinase [Candidatus Peribacteraceae bacterium]|nr:pyruvate kinase [Candidatus Peribacteraceae bacterium]
MRFTKITATIGPATSEPATLERLIKSGVAVARLNFSHGNHESHEKVITTLHDIQKRKRVAIMLDTKGPEIRTGDVTAPMMIEKGDEIIFTHKPTGKEKLRVVKVDYDGLPGDVKDTKVILIDNGAIEFHVTSIKGDAVTAKALEPGKIGSRRHINIPGAFVSLPSFTKKDWTDIEFGIKHDVDFIATSFVRTGKDIRELKNFLKKHKSQIEVIAKIETQQSLDNLSDIIDESDAIMIARGDLGVETPYEDVPRIQDEIVLECRKKGKPVIVATHMLESMIQYPMPTRAEVTDIAHAAMSQADCTMLSGETAGGMYPFKCMDAMTKILDANEKIDTLETMLTLEEEPTDYNSATRYQQAMSASILARNTQADAIIVITKHGRTAKAVSNWRPLMPIIAFTDSESVARRLMLSWAVDPYCIPFFADPEKTVNEALIYAKDQKLIRKDQTVIIVSDILSGKTPVSSIQIRKVL